MVSVYIIGIIIIIIIIIIEYRGYACMMTDHGHGNTTATKRHFINRPQAGCSIKNLLLIYRDVIVACT